MANILIVEDDKTLRGVLKQKLELYDHKVTEAKNGEEALEAMRKNRPDLVLLDILMPKVDGFEVLADMQADSSLKTIPVIVLSNSGQSVEIERVLKLGAKDYLIKANFDPNEVLDKVNRYLKGGKPSSKSKAPFEGGVTRMQSYSVLIIEDDKFLRSLLVLKLKTEHFSVIEAVDGEEGLEKMKKEKPDIVVLDLILPGIDGFTFLEEVKKDTVIGSIPVIVLSNLGQREDIERARALGARDYLIKAQLAPIEIIEKIRSVLREAYI